MEKDEAAKRLFVSGARPGRMVTFTELTRPSGVKLPIGEHLGVSLQVAKDIPHNLDGKEGGSLAMNSRDIKT